MESRFNLSKGTAELAEELRGENAAALDAMVSKLIPYGIYRKEQVDVATIFFEDARRDFHITEAEEGLGRALTDREVRELIVAAIGMTIPCQAEIAVCYNASCSPAACVRLEEEDWDMSCEDLVAVVCRDVDMLPLLDLYPCYEGDDGELYDVAPEDARGDALCEITATDIFFCTGAEPDYLEGITKALEAGENFSYDYLVPGELFADDEDIEEDIEEEEAEGYLAGDPDETAEVELSAAERGKWFLAGVDSVAENEEN